MSGLENFSIFDILGMPEQNLKAQVKRSLDFWLKEVRMVKDPGEALALLNQLRNGLQSRRSL
jgi:hypothetical protein